MLYKGTPLFDISALEKRKLADQAEFEKITLPFLLKFREIVDNAMDAMCETRDNKPPLSVNQNWAPNEMNGLIIDALVKEFPQYARETGRGRGIKFVIDGKYEIYIKKLNEKTLKPSYNHTYTSKAMCEQAVLPNQEPIPVIFIGYTATKSVEQLTGYYAVCTKAENGINWITDITTLFDADHGVEANNNPATLIDVTPTVVVKPKFRKEAK